WRNDYGIARQGDRDADWRSLRVFILPVWNVAVELHSGGICRGRSLRAAGIEDQFAASWGDDHHHHAGTSWRLALDSCAAPRGRSLPGHYCGSSCLHADISRPGTAEAARWAGSGVSITRRIL